MRKEGSECLYRMFSSRNCRDLVSGVRLDIGSSHKKSASAAHDDTPELYSLGHQEIYN